MPSTAAQRHPAKETLAQRLVSEVLVALQGLLTRAAIGAARTAVLLGGVGKRHEAIAHHAREVEQVTARLRESLLSAARSAADSASASSGVADITREGRIVSARSLESMRTLLRHSESTNERLTSLLGKVREVTGVSALIGDIAGRTRFLALNASIEATRAGAAGRAFDVVAGEVRELAKSTAEKARKIDELVSDILADLEPARAAVEESRLLAEHTSISFEAVDQKLGEIAGLADVASGHGSGIALALQNESEAMSALAGAAQSVAGSLQELHGETRRISEAAFAVASVTDEGHHQLARLEIDTMFHHSLGLCRELAEQAGRVLDGAVNERRCSLEGMLALDYREIKGAEIASLRHLFDVSRVPAAGFTPPKFHTAYDALVDEALQRRGDELLVHEPRLLFALTIDLNSYAPAHNRCFSKDWTGDETKDVAGNRMKRFFTDNSVLVRGARAGLNAQAQALPYRSSRKEFEATGCDLTASPAQREAFMVQTYARDTGALVTVITVPIFVQGLRWGAALIGWTEGN